MTESIETSNIANKKIYLNIFVILLIVNNPNCLNIFKIKNFYSKSPMITKTYTHISMFKSLNGKKWFHAGKKKFHPRKSTFWPVKKILSPDFLTPKKSIHIQESHSIPGKFNPQRFKGWKFFPRIKFTFPEMESLF